jgi:hypothetical protein
VEKTDNFRIFIGMQKRTIPGAVILIRWWKGPPVAVILPPGTEPAIQLTTEKAAGALQAYAPRGPVEAMPLTTSQKHLLTKRGMNPQLFAEGRVFAVSDEIASRFDADGKASLDLARQIGLSVDDVARIHEAKRRLTAFQPKTFAERKAKRGLLELFTLRIKNKRGRPGTITTEERCQMGEDARKLRSQGKKQNEIVRILSQRYELRQSYAKRILEDAYHAP